MKREEMLNKISEVIHTYRRNTVNTTSDQLAELILTVVEDAGMSPPDHDGTVFGWNEGYISPPQWE